MIKSKMKNIRVKPVSPKLEYRRLNIYNEYRDYNGYVFKVLGECNQNLEGEYYNDRKKTCVPVINGDYLILSKYVIGHDNPYTKSYYKLLMADFSCPKGFKEVMNVEKNKTDIYKYLVSNKLIGTITGEDNSCYQMSRYLSDYFKNVITMCCDRDKNYSRDDIGKILENKIFFEGKIYSTEDFELNMRQKDIDDPNFKYTEYFELRKMDEPYRISCSIGHILRDLFELSNRSFLSVDELVNYSEIFSYNYEYNL